MPRDTDSIFAHGAVIVPDFVTPAEEARILLRIAEAPWLAELRRRVQHYGFRYDYTGRRLARSGAGLPAVGQCHGRANPAALRRNAPGAVHRERVPPSARASGCTPTTVTSAPWSRPFRSAPRGRCASAAATPAPTPATACRTTRSRTLPRRSVLVLAGPARTAFMHGIDRADTARETVAARLRDLPHPGGVA